jgi:hypothetical protein
MVEVKDVQLIEWFLERMDVEWIIITNIFSMHVLEIEPRILHNLLRTFENGYKRLLHPSDLTICPHYSTSAITSSKSKCW